MPVKKSKKSMKSKKGGGHTTKPASKPQTNYLLAQPVMQLPKIFKTEAPKKKNKTRLSGITEDTRMSILGERQSQRNRNPIKKYTPTFSISKKRDDYISTKEIPAEISRLEALIIKKKEEILSYEQKIYELRKRQLQDIDSANLAEQLQNLMVSSIPKPKPKQMPFSF